MYANTTPTQFPLLVTIAFLLTLGAGPALSQDLADDPFVIKSGVLAFELDPDLPSSLVFEIEELETHLCGDGTVTTAGKNQKQDETPVPIPTVHLGLGPIALCTEIKEPDRTIPIFEEGGGVLISIDTTTTLARKHATTLDLRADILHLASLAPFALSCGEWALEVDLSGDQDLSPAAVLIQEDNLGGLINTDLHVDLELVFTELQTGTRVTLFRDQTFSGATSWSSKAISLGLADAAFDVLRDGPDSDPGEACFATVELAAVPFSMGWTAKQNPQPQSFCLTDWHQQGQLCLRPRVQQE